MKLFLNVVLFIWISLFVSSFFTSCEGLSVTIGPDGINGNYSKEFEGGKILIPININPEK